MHSRPSGFGKPNRYRLLDIPGSVPSFSHMFDFLTDKFPGLR